jgi:hypothetical protein
LTWVHDHGILEQDGSTQCEVLVSSGGAAATGVVLGIVMALAAIGGIEASTADLDSTATDTTPSDFPTAVDGGIDSTELATRAVLDDLLPTVLVGDEVVLARWSAAAPAMRHGAGWPGGHGAAVTVLPR